MSTTMTAPSELTRAAERYLEANAEPLVMNTYLKITILCLVVVCLTLAAAVCAANANRAVSSGASPCVCSSVSAI